MALIDIFKGSDNKADPNEATDLALHVRQCERRYASLNWKLNLLLFMAGIYALLSPEQLAKVIDLLAGQ